MAPTLTVTDMAAVPSGISAAVAGSAGGVNTVFVSRGDPADPAADAGWVAGATFTGDATVTVPLRCGVY